MKLLEILLSDGEKTRHLIQVLERFNLKIVEGRRTDDFDIVIDRGRLPANE